MPGLVSPVSPPARRAPPAGFQTSDCATRALESRGRYQRNRMATRPTKGLRRPSPRNDYQIVKHRLRRTARRLISVPQRAAGDLSPQVILTERVASIVNQFDLQLLVNAISRAKDQHQHLLTSPSGLRTRQVNRHEKPKPDKERRRPILRTHRGLSIPPVHFFQPPCPLCGKARAAIPGTQQAHANLSTGSPPCGGTLQRPHPCGRTDALSSFIARILPNTTVFSPN